MKIIVSANQKGGVGKTTTAVTLAGWFARRGARTLLVDLDPHGSLTSYFGLDPDRVEGGVHGLFLRAAGDQSVPLAALVQRTRHASIGLMPASTALAALDRQFGARDGMGRVLGAALRQLEGHFDHAVVDCPPMLGVLLVNALGCADHVLVPVQSEYLALKGYERFLRTLSMVGHSRAASVPFTVVPTLFDRRTRAGRDSLDWLRSQAGPALWPGVIPVDTRFREASRRGIPLPLLDPEARGALAYLELLDWLQESRAWPPATPRRAGTMAA